MSNAEDLDQALRAKLQATAQLDPVSERPERHAAWAAALAREQRAAKQRRQATLVSLAGGMALAAVAMFLVWRVPNTQRHPLATSAAPCALPAGLSVQTDVDGTQRVKLGPLGMLAATPDSTLRVERSDACLLALVLERGELAGDLNKLSPAVLRVRTPQATVVVRGTRFAVRADSELEVVLLSGRVEVVEPSVETRGSARPADAGRTRMLEPRHVLRKRGASWQMSQTEEPEERRVARLLAGAEREPSATAQTPSSTQPPDTTKAPESAHARVSSGELLARAESARRQGLAERARGLYAQASAQADADAEVALLRWVRLELAARAFDDAGKLLAQHRQRFAAGKLKVEAAWLGVVLLSERGDESSARDAARKFVASFPSAPQADAARALLQAPP